MQEESKKHATDKLPLSDLGDSDLEIAFFTALYQTYTMLPGADNETLLLEILTPKMREKIDLPFAITSLDGTKFQIYTEQTKELERLQNKSQATEKPLDALPLPSSPMRARFFERSHSALPTQSSNTPKTDAKNDSNNVELYQAYYEIRKKQIADALEYLSDEDSVLLLDELFLIKATLQVEDQKLMIEWQTPPEKKHDMLGEIKQEEMDREIEKVKKTKSKTPGEITLTAEEIDAIRQKILKNRQDILAILNKLSGCKITMLPILRRALKTGETLPREICEKLSDDLIRSVSEPTMCLTILKKLRR